jgi:hypothetical protein
MRIFPLDNDVLQRALAPRPSATAGRYNLLHLESFRWEGQDVLPPGKHTIVFDFKSGGRGFGKGGTGCSKGR